MKKFLFYGLKWTFVLTNLVVLVGAHLLGIVIHEIIVHVSDTSSVFPFGTFMTLFAIMALGLFVNWQEEMQQFNLSVSMGETRKKFFASYGIQYFLMMLIDWVVVFATYWVENYRLNHFYHGLPVELNLSGLFHPLTFILVPLFMAAFGMLVGGLGLKMGSNSRWVVIIIWIAIVMGLSKMEGGMVFLEMLSWPAYVWAIIAAAISVVLIIVSALMIRRQRVDI